MSENANEITPEKVREWIRMPISITTGLLIARAYLEKCEEANTKTKIISCYGKTIESFREENQRLQTIIDKQREALLPFARVGELPNIKRHPDCFLWSFEDSQAETIRISALDVIRAAEALALTATEEEK